MQQQQQSTTASAALAGDASPQRDGINGFCQLTVMVSNARNN